MTCRALPRSLVWGRGFPPMRPLPRPWVRFALGPCLILFKLNLVPSFEVHFRPPIANTDHCPKMRTTSLDVWFGDFAVPSQLLAAQHPFTVLDHTIAPSLRHAFNSSSSAFASFKSAVSNPSENQPKTAASSSRALNTAWLHILRIRKCFTIWKYFVIVIYTSKFDNLIMNN